MKKVLIVSSSASFLQRNNTLLRRSDFLIKTTSTGSHAVELLRNEGIDLMIADMQLEDMEGERLCELVKKEGAFPGLSLILICRDSQEDSDRLRNCGADALIARPIRPLQLIKTVGQYLTVQLVRSRRVTLRVKVLSEKDSVEFFCLSHNVSLTGIMIETEHRFEVGNTLTCIFTLPGSIQVNVKGDIVRSSRTMEGSYQYGLNFVNLNRSFRQEIDKYIAQVSKESGKN